MENLKNIVLDEHKKSKKSFIFESGVNLNAIDEVNYNSTDSIEKILANYDYICQEVSGYILCNQKYSQKNTHFDISYEEYSACLDTIWNTAKTSPLVRATLRLPQPLSNRLPDFLLSFSEKQRRQLQAGWDGHRLNSAVGGIKTTDLTKKQCEIWFNYLLDNHMCSIFGVLKRMENIMHLVKSEKVKIYQTKNFLIILSGNKDESYIIFSGAKNIEDYKELYEIQNLTFSGFLWIPNINNTLIDVPKELPIYFPKIDNTPYNNADDCTLGDVVRLINRKSIVKYRIDKSLKNKRITLIQSDHFVAEDLVSAILSLYNLSLTPQKSGVLLIGAKYGKEKLALEDLETCVHDILPASFLQYLKLQIRIHKETQINEMVAKFMTQHPDLGEEYYRDFLKDHPRPGDIFGDANAARVVCQQLKDSMGETLCHSIKSTFKNQESLVYSQLSEEQRQMLGTMLFLEAFDSLQQVCAPLSPSLKYFNEGVLHVTSSRREEKRVPRHLSHLPNRARRRIDSIEMIHIRFILPEESQGYGESISIPDNFGYQFPL
jgi:hypothetical protein